VHLDHVKWVPVIQAAEAQSPVFQRLCIFLQKHAQIYLFPSCISCKGA
jgi:hypothetical protein